MQTTACVSPDDYCAHLEQNPAEGKLFQNSLQNHFSQFFRNPLTFAVLEGVILPELIQRKKQKQRSEIRIWSAGCAAGQEACSLAILLEEALGNIGPGLTYRIFATDLDESQLEQARDGYYPAAALDNMSLKRTRTWFTPQDEGYRVSAPERARLPAGQHLRRFRSDSVLQPADLLPGQDTKCDPRPV